jgi:hypothetical protein
MSSADTWDGNAYRAGNYALLNHCRTGKDFQRILGMSDSESWPFANLLTLSERIGSQAPLGMLHEAGRLAVKMQVSGQRRHRHVSGCTFDLVPPGIVPP